MRRHALWAWAYLLIGAWLWVAGTVSGVIAGVWQVPVERCTGYWTWTEPMVSWAHTDGHLVAAVLIASLGLGQLTRNKIGPPLVWPVIQRTLDEFRKLAFEKKTGTQQDHRVTLFKVVRWQRFFMRWPWTRCLVPVARSGHTSRRTAARFRIPDNAERAEGIAGRAWAEKRPVVVNDLPDVHDESADLQMFKDYSSKTWVTADWARDRRPYARSYVGIPVEVGGKIWGVLVLDSKDTKIIGRAVPGVYYSMMAIIAGLIERPTT